MGLDQFAYKRKLSETGEQTHQFYWRKHAKLQEFMENLFYIKTRAEREKLNCSELSLNIFDIEILEELVKYEKLPHCEGGFLYGHQFQDESAADYKEQDLEFCKWAKSAIKEGYNVIYSCWW